MGEAISCTGALITARVETMKNWLGTIAIAMIKISINANA